MGGGARPRDFQRPVGARLASLRIQRAGERASTGRAGPQCRVGHGARSAHALTASSFSMNWNGAGAGQRPAYRQPDETPSPPDETGPCWSRSTTGSPTWSGSPERSRTWSRCTPVGKSRPASSLASHARRRLPRSSSRRRSWPRCPPWWSYRPAARVFTPPAPRGRLRPACVRRAPSADARRCKMSSIPRSPARPQARPPAREDTPLHTSATARAAR